MISCRLYCSVLSDCLIRYLQHGIDHMELTTKRKERLALYSRSYRQRNREKCRQRYREWARRNRALKAAYMRRYRKARPDIFRRFEQKRIRPLEHRRKFNEYHRRWVSENRDKRQEYYQRRRAGLRAENDLTAAQIRAQRQKQNGICAYGQHLLDNNGMGHVDHKQPLCRGGRNTASNIVIACSKCNLKKGRKTYEQFIEGLRY